MQVDKQEWQPENWYASSQTRVVTNYSVRTNESNYSSIVVLISDSSFHFKAFLDFS